MGFFKHLARWWRRDRRGSPFTLVEGPGGEKVLVDPAMLAYLESQAPHPTQASLDAMLDNVHTIRVFKSGCYQDALLGEDLLLEVTDPSEVAGFRHALAIVDGPGGHCMCYGGPTLEMLSANGARLALLGIHHGQAIRWTSWKDDARLADGRVLLDWLAERGVSEPLREFEAGESRRREREQAWNHWVESMPEYLRILPEEVWQQVTTSQDLTALLAAAAEACTDSRERILALFRWYGSGRGPWSGYPDWEQFPERLLSAFPRADLVSAGASASLSEAELEGAARFFAGSAFQAPHRKLRSEEGLSLWYSDFDVFQPARSGEPADLPEAFRRTLWAHCQESGDPDKRQRGESAFRIAREYLADKPKTG